ncbi:AMP-binding protein [Tepidibacter aestuarii]|uniref:AMP-binding protein n=1 Tax=Tepidibacter aestuarii TaxID=2925782 RepID=UPI0020BDF949|nr:AMP-binding protein [Tepidibacter aestuarii]CAH2214361.1 putative Long-chain acyl-CoA synthetase [Tepidibacter aestuarii]
MLIYSNLRKFANLQPNKIAIKKGLKIINYKKLDFITDFIAKKFLTVLDSNNNNNVFIKQFDEIYSIIYLISLSKINQTSILVDIDFNENIYQNLYNKVKPKLVIDDTFNYNEIIDNIIYNNFDYIPIDLNFNLNSDNIFLGCLSSGSTGDAKLIFKNHNCWVKAFKHQSDIFKISKDDKLFLVGNLVYTANLNSAIHMIYTGGSVVFSTSKFPKTWIKEIYSNKITYIFMVPSHYKLLIKSMKNENVYITSLLSCGCKMDIKTLKNIIKLFPNSVFHEYYGASELGHVSYISSNQILEKQDSVGIAFPEVQIHIKDSIVSVTSPYISPMYPDTYSVLDTGYLKDGYLYLTGRLDNMINKAGYKIIPSKVESIILNSYFVEDVCLFSVHDNIKNQKLCAFIVKSEQFNYIKFKQYLKNNLAKNTIPQIIKYVDSIPLNASGKPDIKFMTKYL